MSKVPVSRRTLTPTLSRSTGRGRKKSVANVRLIPDQLLIRARAKRKESAPAEAKMWQGLRNRQLGGFKFRRQTPLPPYIADFYCLQTGLVVELDGDSHAQQETYDARRTTRLVRDGVNVIRFLNTDVQSNLDAVLEEILFECWRLASSKSPSLDRAGTIGRPG